MLDEDTQKALDIARRLIRAGVPVFAAAPVPGSEGHYVLPKEWQKTVPSEVWLEKWQPGWGLAAVGGRVCDFLDVDPRNGGDESIMELEDEGTFPLTFGEQATPSGGHHWIVAPTGERKGAFMPGLDLQAGDEAGVGRGFVWIAPTVRPSKDPKDAGTLRAYEWTILPDLELLEEQMEDARESVRPIIERIRAKRAAPAERTAAAVVDPDDPFMTSSQATALAYGGERSFTLTEAQDFVRPALLALQAAPVGQIEESANTAAAVLSHFVPAFWDVESAYALLTAALGHTAYDPNGPSDWTAEKFRAVLDGRRPPLDPWKATRRPEPAAPPAAVVEAAPGEEQMTVLERLRAKLVSAEELSRMPTPEYLIEDVLDVDSESWIIGAPGSFKSFVVLDMAAHVATGMPWQERRVKQGKVLYLAAEGARGMTKRARAWMQHHNSTMPGATFLPYPVRVQSNDGQWDALVQIARELEPILVVIDTQARVSAGLDENSAKDMTILTDAVGRLKRATGACVLVVHHTGRNGGDARGSSAIDGAQDTELKVMRPDPKERVGEKALICNLVMDKQKDMADGGAGIPLALAVEKLDPDPETGRELSSLVVLAASEADAVYRAAQISIQGELEVDVKPWKGMDPGDWTKTALAAAGLPTNATLRRRILQVLADHAHDRGLTKAEALKVVTARWYAAKSKGPDADSWTDAWNVVVSMPLAVNVAGERFVLDHVELSTFRDGQ